LVDRSKGSSEDEDSSDTNSEKQEVVKSKPSKQIADRITNAKLSSGLALLLVAFLTIHCTYV